MICRFCSKECKNKNQEAQHVRWCKLNPDRVEQTENQKIATAEYNKSGENYFKLVNSDKTSEAYKKLRSNSKSARLANLQSGKTVIRGTKHTEEAKQKISSTMKRVALSHRDLYDRKIMYGRVKRYTHNNQHVHGTWELIVSIYLSNNNIPWLRIDTPFKYTYQNSERSYFPDFYIPSQDVYIEVKGYETDKDRAKWLAFPKTLIILKVNEINDLRNGKLKLFKDDKILLPIDISSYIT